jgi:hypothetical protein
MDLAPGRLEDGLMGGSRTIGAPGSAFSSRTATSRVKLPPWPLMRTTLRMPLLATERTTSLTASASVIGRSHTVPAIGL